MARDPLYECTLYYSGGSSSSSPPWSSSCSTAGLERATSCVTVDVARIAEASSASAFDASVDSMSAKPLCLLARERANSSSAAPNSTIMALIGAATLEEVDEAAGKASLS